MTNEMILDLYGTVYDFTDQLDDQALNILNEHLDNAGVYDEFMLLMEDPAAVLDESKIPAIREALQDAIAECEEECE